MTAFLGCDITAADGLEGTAPVVVVSHGVWQTLLGGRRDALGTMLDLDGVAHEIVGIASPGFDYPAGTEIWRARPRNEGCARGCRVLRAISRLADARAARGVSELCPGRNPIPIGSSSRVVLERRPSLAETPGGRVVDLYPAILDWSAGQ